MDYVSAAEDFLSHYGWGSRGKNIGISRMLNDSDISLLSRGKVFISTRPRGILSGFLCLLPSLRVGVYMPPLAAKMGPRLIRMRCDDSIWKEGGAIFSAYMTREKQLIVEDVLMWKSKYVWNNDTFETRWNHLLKNFMENLCVLDTQLQGIEIQVAKYTQLQNLQKPDMHTVIEFIYNTPNQKRLIWIMNEEVQNESQKQCHTIRREANMGPDIYSVWDNEKRIGLALVRTLAISKQLRIHTKDVFEANTEWNPLFEKWEIMGIV